MHAYITKFTNIQIVNQGLKAVTCILVLSRTLNTVWHENFTWNVILWFYS